MVVIAGIGFGILVAGWSGLDMRLPGGLPLGNAVAALILILPAWAALLLSRPAHFSRRLSAAALTLAILWLPASIGLAGNPELNFGESTGTLWFVFSVIAFLASFIALLLSLANVLLSRRGRA